MLPRRACTLLRGRAARFCLSRYRSRTAFYDGVGSGLSWNSWALGTCLAAYCCIGTQYCCTRWVQTRHEY